MDSLSQCHDCLRFSFFGFVASKIGYFAKNQWNCIDFLIKSYILEENTQKIKNPRQSCDKESIERDDFFYRIKISWIAEEKKIFECRPLPPFSDSLLSVQPPGSGSPAGMDAY